MVTSRRMAKDIMSSPVYTVRPSDPLGKVVEMICRHRISGVPVVKGKGRLIGLISERDIIHAMYPGYVGIPGKPPGQQMVQGLRDVSELLAKDIMVTQVITADPDTDFLRLASIMALQKIRRIPIVEGEILVGIVSHGDVGRSIYGTPERSGICPALHSNGDPPKGNGS